MESLILEQVIGFGRGVFEEVFEMLVLYSIAALTVAAAALAGAYSLLKDSLSNDW